MKTNNCLANFLAFILVAFSTALVGQVHNYENPSVFNIVNTPGLVASKQLDNSFTVSHLQGFSHENPLTSSSFKYSKFFQSSFVGMGVSVNRTRYGSGVGYDNLGLAFGYRNILFNKLFVRVGAMYNLNQSKGPAGTFDYYNHRSQEVNDTKGLGQNLNLSLTLGNSGSTRYISFSKLNLPLDNSAQTNGFTFPGYYSWNVGNFLAFGGTHPETKLTYQGFVKKVGDTTTVSHYVNFQVNTRLNRKLSLNIGGRIGTTEGNMYHIAPMAQVYGERFAVQAYHNLHLLEKSFMMPLPQSTQLQFTYKFY